MTKNNNNGCKTAPYSIYLVCSPFCLHRMILSTQPWLLWFIIIMILRIIVWNFMVWHGAVSRLWYLPYKSPTKMKNCQNSQFYYTNKTLTNLSNAINLPLQLRPSPHHKRFTRQYSHINFQPIFCMRKTFLFYNSFYPSAIKFHMKLLPASIEFLTSCMHSLFSNSDSNPSLCTNQQHLWCGCLGASPDEH